MGLINFLLDIYENVRKTNSNFESSKPKVRKYDFDAGFTGKKKEDYKPKIKKAESKSVMSEKTDENER